MELKKTVLVPWAHLVHLSDGNERYIVFSMVGEDDVLPTDFIGGCGGKIHKLTRKFKNTSIRDKK